MPEVPRSGIIEIMGNEYLEMNRAKIFYSEYLALSPKHEGKMLVAAMAHEIHFQFRFSPET